MYSLDVQFTGCTTRTGGITWAQQDIYDFIYGERGQAGQASPDLHSVVNPKCEPSTEDCVEAIRILVSRHEALRTTLKADNGKFLAQHVSSEGAIPVLIDDAGVGQEEQTAASLMDLLTGRQISVTTDLPFRVGLVTSSGTVRRIVLVISRMVVDGWGFENLLQGLVQEIFRIRRADDFPAQLFHQLDQWEWECSSSGAMRAKAALAYRMKLLEKCAVSSGERLAPGNPVGRMRRGGLLLGADFTESMKRAARSMSVTTSTVLLTSCALAASDIMGVADFVLNLHCANRFKSSQIHSVTRLKSMSLMSYRQESYEISEEVKRVWRSALVAYQHAQVPPSEEAEIVRRAENRFFVEFNDRHALAERVDGDPLGGADLTEYSTSKINVVASARRSGGPYMGFSVDPRPGLRGVSVRLESNVLHDEEIVSTLTSVRESLQHLLVGAVP